MENLYFYISGFVTAVFFILSIYYSNAFRKAKKEISKILSDKEAQSKELQKLIEYKESKTRYADYIWEGWYNTKTPHEKYGVVFHLKQIAKSEDNPNLFKFEVVSILSQEKNDPWTIKDYSEYFYKEKAGWLDTSKLGKNFNWVVSKTKEEQRDDKIKDILGNQED